MRYKDPLYGMEYGEDCVIVKIEIKGASLYTHPGEGAKSRQGENTSRLETEYKGERILSSWAAAKSTKGTRSELRLRSRERGLNGTEKAEHAWTD